MLPGHEIPLLLGILVGLLLGLVAWGFSRGRRREVCDDPMGKDGLLLGLLVLASFALGTFLAYLLLSTQ